MAAAVVNAMIPGRRVEAIFGFTDIQSGRRRRRGGGLRSAGARPHPWSADGRPPGGGVRRPADFRRRSCPSRLAPADLAGYEADLALPKAAQQLARTDRQTHGGTDRQQLTQRPGICNAVRPTRHLAHPRQQRTSCCCSSEATPARHKPRSRSSSSQCSTSSQAAVAGPQQHIEQHADSRREPPGCRPGSSVQARLSAWPAARQCLSFSNHPLGHVGFRASPAFVSHAVVQGLVQRCPRAWRTPAISGGIHRLWSACATTRRRPPGAFRGRAATLRTPPRSCRTKC